MQDLSFHFPNVSLELWGYTAQVMVYTFENAYGMDANHTRVSVQEDHINVVCDQLTYAGGQLFTPALLHLTARRVDGRVLMDVSVKHPKQPIRSVKVTLCQLPVKHWVNKLDLSNPEITKDGLNVHYPEGWRTIDTPMLLLLGEGEGLTCIRSLDTRVRDKRFVMRKVGNGADVELIFEQYAMDVDYNLAVPTWEISQVESMEEAYARQQKHIEKAYHLVEWEKRSDVPAWAKKISLVAAIHGQHWTGYIMNDYEKMLSSLEWFAKRIEGEKILAFMPGWEGRYYWQYGDYRPCPRMGGEKGFKRLCDGANEMGIHLMPMFGINIVNRDIEGFEHWGEPSQGMSINGHVGGGSVDWDGARHYDHGSNASLNPSAPMWQRRLTHQINGLANQYGFQSAFLDIAACWYNDPRFQSTDEGVKVLCDRLRAGVKDMLVCGEAWYDGLSKAMPVIHSGHTDGPMHYHDALNAPFFDTYMREFAHLCLGDAGRGSTGVHELGTNDVQWRVPLRKGLWPTATIVEDTLEKAPEKVEMIIEDAKEYARQYLEGSGAQ